MPRFLFNQQQMKILFLYPDIGRCLICLELFGTIYEDHTMLPPHLELMQRLLDLLPVVCCDSFLRKSNNRLFFHPFLSVLRLLSALICVLLLLFLPLVPVVFFLDIRSFFLVLSLRKYRRLHMIDFLVRILWLRTFGTFCVLRFRVLRIFHNTTLNHKRLRQRNHNKHTYDCCKNKQNLPEHDCTHNRTDSSDSEQQ